MTIRFFCRKHRKVLLKWNCFKCVAEQIFADIEKQSDDLGIEPLAKKYPDFVRYIAYNYDDWQKVKRKWLK